MTLKVKTKLKICGSCKGEGYKWITTRPARHGSDIEEGQWQNCQVCLGSGMVIETKRINTTTIPYKPDKHE
jgi:DnaJ-class molecular chaperone